MTTDTLARRATVCSRFTFTLIDGTKVFGSVQGAGGELRVDGLRRIRRAIAGHHGHSVTLVNGAFLVSPQLETTIHVPIVEIVDIAEAPSLDDLLYNAGYSQRHSHGYKHDIFDSNGEVVFTGSAHETSEWLRGRAA